MFGGRLGEYKYYDMHQVIGSALAKSAKYHRREYMTYGVRMMIWAGLNLRHDECCGKAVARVFRRLRLYFFGPWCRLFCPHILSRRKRIPYFGNNKRVLLLRGLFGTTALMLFFYTIQVLPLASAMVIHYLSPIFTALIAHFFLKERLKLNQIFFFIVSFAGIVS